MFKESRLLGSEENNFQLNRLEGVAEVEKRRTFQSCGILFLKACKTEMEGESSKCMKILERWSMCRWLSPWNLTVLSQKSLCFMIPSCKGQRSFRNRPRGNHSCVRWQRLSYLLLCCLGSLISQKSLVSTVRQHPFFIRGGSLSELWLYLQHKWLCNGLLFFWGHILQLLPFLRPSCLHVFPWQDAAQLIVQEETKPVP